MAKTKINFGQRASSRITRIVGSWRFIVIQSVILFFWIIFNIVAWTNHWDPYPFIFLNLALSFQAAYTAPIILMSENRELDLEKRKTAIDLATDRKSEREIQKIKKQLERLERGKIDKILKIITENK